MKKFCVLLSVCALPLQSIVASSSEAAGNGSVGEFGAIARLQRITDDLRDRMDILERVVVTIVDYNPLVMSVETLGGRSGPFVISADRHFVQSLSGDEVQASLAHELGHVWIYTHHPYVQSERLANDIAMRVISPEVLVPVYEKVFQRLGTRGNLADYLSLPEEQ
jgi:hypothetical protein